MALSIDIETYSDVDIKTAGVYAYADSPAFEILLIAYSFEHGKSDLIDLTGIDQPLDFIRGYYPEFFEALTDPKIIKTAYNANFERTCLAKYLETPMPPEQWHCTAVHAAMLGLPRSLADVGKAINLAEDEQKLATGKALITYFCNPCKPTKANGGRTRNLPAHAPEKWELFKQYCCQDVVAEYSISDRLSSFPVPESEWTLWNFDQRMNDRGVRLDIDFVKGIVSHDELSRSRLLYEATQISALQNPNSLSQLKKWMRDNSPINIDSLTKDAVPVLMKRLSDLVTDGSYTPEEISPLIRMLEIRQALGKTSTAKYSAMLSAVCSDNRLRGVLQFYGANRTGRWAGRIVQVHNLPQNKIPDIDLARELAAEQNFELLEIAFGESAFVFSQLIRTAFIASEGCRFVVSDFSAIEARVIAWVSGEQWRLDVFNTHGKIYEASASQMFHVPIEHIKKGSKLRQQGKVAELALGYQGAFGAIKKMDRDNSIPDEEIPMLVANWRAANPKICRLWRTVEAAAKAAITERRLVKIQHGIEFRYKEHILFIKLPSGRSLAYWDARVEETKDGKSAVMYAGVNQETKAWGTLETYGGKLVENIIQAIARDCLAVAMLRVDAAGYNIVMHVHDEMIVDVPCSDTEAADRITAIMAMPIEWAPGLPLKGETYETPFYKKD